MSISIIIPCFNSEKYILKNIEKLQKVIQKTNQQYEIVIIDDDSKDTTYEIINKFYLKIKY